MQIDETTRRILDAEHLRLLALFHYISGAMTILFSSFFIIHLLFMGMMLSNPELFEQTAVQTNGPDPRQFIGFMTTIIGFMVLLGIVFGVAQIISGRFMSQRRHRIFTIIVAIPNLLFIPYGTILGVFALIVLDRDSVKALYESGQ